MLYGVFVIATTIVVMFNMMLPVVNAVYSTTPKPRIVETGNKYLVLFILAIVSIITAPAMLLVYLVPEFNFKFMEMLEADLKKS